MKRQVRVTFLGHSGFLMETAQHYLLFDYWTGDLPELRPGKPLYVFVSHSHHDHYNPEIYDFETELPQVSYILSADVREADSAWKNAGQVHFMKEHEEAVIGDCRVETLLSTDLGVAYLIELDGLHIYHAGDLHWWEWPGEPEEENQAYIRNYKAELARMAGRKLDIAFVVLDPRQEWAGGRGMDAFLDQIGASYVYPMHLWEDYRLSKHYIDKNQKRYPDSQIMEIREAGQTWDILC